MQENSSFICFHPKKMNKLFIVFLIIFPIRLFAQSISGKVLDTLNKPVKGASVYIEGTYIGAVADTNGYFKFDVHQSIKYPILLNAALPGYFKVITKLKHLPDSALVIRLTEEPMRFIDEGCWFVPGSYIGLIYHYNYPSLPFGGGLRFSRTRLYLMEFDYSKYKTNTNLFFTVFKTYRLDHNCIPKTFGFSIFKRNTDLNSYLIFDSEWNTNLFNVHILSGLDYLFLKSQNDSSNSIGLKVGVIKNFRRIDFKIVDKYFGKYNFLNIKLSRDYRLLNLGIEYNRILKNNEFGFTVMYKLRV